MFHKHLCLSNAPPRGELKMLRERIDKSGKVKIYTREEINRLTLSKK
jgi:hypothetical protein